MEQIKILKREVIMPTGYKKFPYKSENQIIVIKGKETYYSKNIDYTTQSNFKNDKLKKPFEITFKTQSLKKLNDYLNNNHFRSESDKWLRWTLNEIALKEFSK